MLDARSAMASAKPFVSEALTLREAPDFTIQQLSWFTTADEKSLKQALGAMPLRVGSTAESDHGLLLRIGPRQLWCFGKLPEFYGDVLVTPLSSSRTRIEVAGAKSRDLLTHCAAIDFHENAFKPGHFVMTGIHHTPVTIHCIAENQFHLYALRTFGLSVWEWLVDASEGLTNA